MRFRVTMQIYSRHFNLKRAVRFLSEMNTFVRKTMVTARKHRQFNLYFAVVLVLTLFGSGCKTDPNEKVFSVLRIHIEVPRMTTTGAPVSILRSNPMLVPIAKEPILTEADVYGAKIVDAQGGFALQLGFNENATWILEQYSAGNPGKHFAIFGQWADGTNNARWLAAPLITHRISDGVLTFTPDMSREEANQFVLGLNNDVKKIRKSQLKTFQ